MGALSPDCNGEFETTRAGNNPRQPAIRPLRWRQLAPNPSVPIQNCASPFRLSRYVRVTRYCLPVSRTSSARSPCESIPKNTGLQAAVDQLLPEPLRQLSAIAKLPPIAALSANGLLAVNLYVATSSAPEPLGKRQQLGVLACSVNVHKHEVPVALQCVEGDQF
jgi:hypothetical protein